MEDWAKVFGFAESKFEKYRIKQDRLYQSDFDLFLQDVNKLTEK